MAIGSAYAAGYNATRKQQRSFMPAVNTLSDIINRRKRARGSIRSGISEGKSAEQRADEFFARSKAEEEERWARAEYEAQQRKAEEKERRSMSLMQAEELRRQEAHELEMQKQQEAMAQQGETFDRKSKMADRAEAYEMVKQGLMMRDGKTVNAALQALVPQGEDVITESTTEGGARKFTGRPAEGQVPQFVFDPETDYVGVIFPGQEKPTVFKDAKQAFENVLAPMNPRNEMTKDEITAAKNKGELKFKNRKLKAENHFKAHEAAMKQFEFEGYFQPAAYNPEKYEDTYWRHIGRAEGMSPEEAKQTFEPPPDPMTTEQSAKGPGAKGKGNADLPKDVYTGDQPPKGYPNARRHKNGAWYIKRGKGWAPILQGKGKGKKKRPAPKAKGQMSHAGFPPVVRKKVPPYGIGGS
jgi:hypothetical protein